MIGTWFDLPVTEQSPAPDPAADAAQPAGPGPAGPRLDRRGGRRARRVVLPGADPRGAERGLRRASEGPRVRLGSDLVVAPGALRRGSSGGVRDRPPARQRRARPGRRAQSQPGPADRAPRGPAGGGCGDRLRRRARPRGSADRARRRPRCARDRHPALRRPARSGRPGQRLWDVRGGLLPVRLPDHRRGAPDRGHRHRRQEAPGPADPRPAGRGDRDARLDRARGLDGRRQQRHLAEPAAALRVPAPRRRRLPLDRAAGRRDRRRRRPHLQDRPERRRASSARGPSRSP